MTPSLRRLHRLRGGLAATAVALVAGCAIGQSAGHTAVDTPEATASTTPATASSAKRGVLAQSVAPSLYEVAYSPSSQSLFVASAGSAVRDGQGGAIYRLDSQTLAVKQKIDLPLKPFALAIDERGHTLYAGHTLDGAVTAIDTVTGAVKGTLRHDLKEEDGKPVHTRQVLFDEAAGKLDVTGTTRGGLLWVIDGKTFKTEQILRDTDAPTTGMTLDAANHRLYVSGTAAYAAFDTRTWQQVAGQRIPEKLQPTDERRRFLVNVALDAKVGHLFANQLNNNEGTLVFDVKSGELLHTIATGESPVGIRYNAVRNEVYVASLGSGTVSVIDAKTYAIKHSIAVPAANSLWLTPDGQTLFVTAKQGTGAQPLDKVVRIDLKAL